MRYKELTLSFSTFQTWLQPTHSKRVGGGQISPRQLTVTADFNYYLHVQMKTASYHQQTK